MCCSARPSRRRVALHHAICRSRHDLVSVALAARSTCRLPFNRHPALVFDDAGAMTLRPSGSVEALRQQALLGAIRAADTAALLPSLAEVGRVNGVPARI